MKKWTRNIILFSLVGVFGLTGCSAGNNKFANMVVSHSQIQEDEDYQKYRQLKSEGQLGLNGYYIDSEPGTASGDTYADTASGQVHVTFAENQYLSIKYYTDAGLTKQIDTTSCYLKPGDSIYASSPFASNPNTNLYEFSEYIVYPYNSNGERSDPLEVLEADDGLVYQIPEQYKGSDLEIIPEGQLMDRSISMRVYNTEDDGTEHELTGVGQWSVNDEDCTGNATQISSVEPYTIKYTYDTEQYYFVGSDPECFTKDPQSLGCVEFWEAEPTDEDKVYSIELQPYFSFTIKIPKKAKISNITLNGSKVEVNEEDKKKNEYSFDSLKDGDVLNFNLEGNQKSGLTSGNMNHIIAENDNTNYRLQITSDKTSVEEREKLDRLFDTTEEYNVVLDTNCKYGEASYKLDGKSVGGSVTLESGSTLKLTYKITEEGYRFEEDSKGTKKFINIRNAPQKTVTIPIDESIDNTIIYPDDYITVVKKEGNE